VLGARIGLKPCADRSNGTNGPEDPRYRADVHHPLDDHREFTLRRYNAEEHCHALRTAAGETVSLSPSLLESCAVSIAITALDLADMTGAEVAEIHDLCIEESLFRRAARGLTGD